MSETDKPRARWKVWLTLAVIAVLFLLLYPHLRDFGGELYRAFA
jgi:hypothetical protein